MTDKLLTRFNAYSQQAAAAQRQLADLKADLEARLAGNGQLFTLLPMPWEVIDEDRPAGAHGARGTWTVDKIGLVHRPLFRLCLNGRSQGEWLEGSDTPLPFDTLAAAKEWAEKHDLDPHGRRLVPVPTPDVTILNG